MRHKYPTESIVLSRTPLSEDSALLTILTREVGLVRARAQGVRKRGAKLASALQTFTESDLVLVAGKEGWRVSGAVLGVNWYQGLSRAARVRAARLSSLMLRLVHGESPDPRLFLIFKGFLNMLHVLPESEHDAVECLAALRLLHVLGLDAGELPEGSSTFTPQALMAIREKRRLVVARINRGLKASGL